jgi:hypothetical protein
VCRHLVWRAVGDPVAVADLLAPIAAIGKSAAPAMATSCPGRRRTTERRSVGVRALAPGQQSRAHCTLVLPARGRWPAVRRGGPNRVTAALHASCSSNSGAAAVALKDITMTAQVNSYLFMPRNYGRS